MSEEFVLADINVGVLYLFAVFGVYGIIMGDALILNILSRRNKISSTNVSYEVSIGIIIIMFFYA